ncbi:MAG: EamA family transporter [Candidatus Hatepunaea meridiana]|nr:EamA family transporter [Candidatus Hatepunaea meridiana]
MTDLKEYSGNSSWVEQIHVGGFKSSIELATRAGLQEGMYGIDLCSALGAQKVPWQTMLIYFALGALVIGLLAKPTMPDFNRYHLIGLAAGFACAIGFMYFYIAISRGFASVVIPLTSLYVVVASVMAFIIILKPITMRNVLGIICGVVAIALLAG